MNNLTTGVTNDSTLAAFLSENTRAAFQLSGAVDADHQQLAILEDEVNRTIVLIDRLLKELSEDIQRQTNFVAAERSNLNTLSASIKSGEILGTSLSNRAVHRRSVLRAHWEPRSTVGRRPLILIRFDRQNVSYDQALYSAVSRALERLPNSIFELVAISPASGSEGATRAEFQSRPAQCGKCVENSAKHGIANPAGDGVGQDQCQCEFERGASLLELAIIAPR